MPQDMTSLFGLAAQVVSEISLWVNVALSSAFKASGAAAASILLAHVAEKTGQQTCVVFRPCETGFL